MLRYFDAAPLGEVLGVFARLKSTAPEWHVISNRKTRLLCDGSFSDARYLWARKTGGEWQYRELTDEEFDQQICDTAI